MKGIRPAKAKEDKSHGEEKLKRTRKHNLPVCGLVPAFSAASTATATVAAAERGKGKAVGSERRDFVCRCGDTEPIETQANTNTTTHLRRDAQTD